MRAHALLMRSLFCGVLVFLSPGGFAMGAAAEVLESEVGRCTSEDDCPRGTCVAQVCETPRSEDLQRIIDTCDTAHCELPAGDFILAETLTVDRSMTIVGADGPLPSLGQPHTTVIRIADGKPVMRVSGDVDVHILDLHLVGGGVEIAGDQDLCAGISAAGDSPSEGEPSVTLTSVSIERSSGDAIYFSGDRIVLQNVTVAGASGHGLYVAHAVQDVVLIGSEYNDNAGWGVVVCNQGGSGQVFMLDIQASLNRRGGVAVVGPARPVCIQDAAALFNLRFGFLLYDVAATLLFDARAGFTFSEPEFGFGDGFAVVNGPDVTFWDVYSALNSRAGFGIFAFGQNSDTHAHIVGKFQAVNNGFDLNNEDGATWHNHFEPTQVQACNGEFTAPPAETHCTHGECASQTSGIVAPELL